MSWKKLREIYAREGIFLALGAGVSVASGLPNWQTILQRLVSTHIDRGDDGLFRDLREHGFTLPILASLLEENTRDRREFIERFRRMLYRDFPFFPQGVDKSNRRQFVRHVQETNLTLRSVASLCAVRNEARRTFEANERIHAIVSFNLDALLQAYIYARYEKRLLRTIERPSASRNPEKINIYHIHGYLRFDPRIGDLSKEAPDAAVLTEQDYFDFFNQPTSLFNYTLLYLLREHSCLFIGLSMQDDNIRRLLHYSKMERLRAFEAEGDSPVDRERLIRHYAVLKRNDNPRVDDAMESTLDPLGTEVLWVDRFEDIRDELEAMYRAGGDDWAAVF